MMIFIANAKSLQPGHRALDVEELDIDALFSAALEEEGNGDGLPNYMRQLQDGLDTSSSEADSDSD